MCGPSSELFLLVGLLVTTSRKTIWILQYTIVKIGIVSAGGVCSDNMLYCVLRSFGKSTFDLMELAFYSKTRSYVETYMLVTKIYFFVSHDSAKRTIIFK